MQLCVHICISRRMYASYYDVLKICEYSLLLRLWRDDADSGWPTWLQSHRRATPSPSPPLRPSLFRALLNGTICRGAGNRPMYSRVRIPPGSRSGRYDSHAHTLSMYCMLSTTLLCDYHPMYTTVQMKLRKKENTSRWRAMRGHQRRGSAEPSRRGWSEEKKRHGKFCTYGLLWWQRHCSFSFCEIHAVALSW